MIQNILVPTIFLASISLISCNMPSEKSAKTLQVARNQTLPMMQVKPIEPDTLGLYQAFLNFSKMNTCSTCTANNQLPAAYWNSLVMTDDSSGIIPASSYVDDSTGFKALFFRRRNGCFQFYCTEAGLEQHMCQPDAPESINTAQVFGGG
jgi:hypothetical protein